MDRYQTTEEDHAYFAKMEVSDKSLSALQQACHKENLNRDAWEKVLFITKGLVNLDRNWVPHIKTPKQRLDSLRDVEKAAIALKKAIENLVDVDLTEFDNQLFWMIGSRSNELHEPGRAAVIHRVVRVTKVAGRRAQRALKTKGVTNLGRKSTLPYHAAFIAELSDALKPHGINTTNAGPFRRLCDAVFAVAIVRSTSEGAIAYYLKAQIERAKTRAADYEEKWLYLNSDIGRAEAAELTDEKIQEAELRYQKNLKDRSIYLI